MIKPNGRIPLYCDFKVTLNAFLKLKNYSLLKLENMAATLRGCVY